jgi:hypothetical protein
MYKACYMMTCVTRLVPVKLHLQRDHYCVRVTSLISEIEDVTRSQ